MHEACLRRRPGGVVSARRTSVSARYEASRDFYETPAWAVWDIAVKLPQGVAVLDPCAGRGAILEALELVGFTGSGIEIDQGRAEEAAKGRQVGCWGVQMAPSAPARPKTCPTCGARVVVHTSDSAAYAWFHWGGRGGQWSILEGAS